MPNRACRVWSAVVPPEWKVTVAGAAVPPASATPLPATLDDHALVAACLDGARGAFDTLVERHRRSVYQLCYRYVGNHEDASDLAQEVFIRAFRGLPRFRGRSAFSTWLYTIGTNVCLNRASTRRPGTEPFDPSRHADATAADPIGGLLASERREQVRAAVARLPRRQREVLTLRVYHELPHREIARMLGSSVGAVKANFFHALANLRNRLREP